MVSYRNSAVAVADMMKKTNCSHIMTLRHAHNGLIEEIREEIAGHELVVDELPTLSYAFPKLGSEVEADPFVPYPAPASRPDLDSPVIYFHSSGSTGFPRPIPHSHKFQICFIGNRQSSFVLTVSLLLILCGYLGMLRSFKNLSVSSRIGVMSFPAFHIFGMGIQLYCSVGYLVAAVVYPPRAVTDPHAAPVIPTTDNVLDCIRWTGCKGLLAVPTFLEQLAASQENVEELKKLEFVVSAILVY